MVQLYRSCLIIQIALLCTFSVMPFYEHMWLSDEQLYLLYQNGLGSKFEFQNFYAWIEVLIWLLLYVGLYFFKVTARIGYLVALIVSLMREIFFGMSVFTPLTSFALTLISHLDGAIIVMAYFTKVGEKFERNS